MVKLDNTLDHATHELQVKWLMRQVHQLLLEREFVAAAATIDATIVELRLMRNAVKSHIKE